MGTFFCTGSLGAGQETTAFTTIPFFAHMGMIYVTFGGKHKVADSFRIKYLKLIVEVKSFFYF